MSEAMKPSPSPAPTDAVKPLTDDELAEIKMAVKGLSMMKRPHLDASKLYSDFSRLFATITDLKQKLATTGHYILAGSQAIKRADSAEQENKRLREALTELMAFDSAAYDRKSDRAKALLAAKHKAISALSPSQVKTE